jgi:peptidoglycan/xylan/chitin deacetylase (PgdA/CDA1 family)
LCYHGLSLDDEHEWNPNLYITPQQFRSRLQSLKDMNASVLPLQDALAHLHAHSLPPRSVVITFDDGFYDFFCHGLPALSEFSYPCTVYLTTYYCGRKLPVITLTLDYLLWKSKVSSVELPEWGIRTPHAIRTYAERQQVVQRLIAWMEANGLTTIEKSEIASRMAERLGIDDVDLVNRRMLQIMSREEAKQISEAGVDIQLHTHRHRSPRDRDLFRREILDNRDVILEITGQNPAHFCYPSGYHVPEFLPWLEELGVQSATTCRKGLATRDSADLVLPRVLDDATLDAVRFESFVSGVFA